MDLIKHKRLEVGIRKMPRTKMKNTNLGCIYLITNTINGKKYVGQHHLPIPDRRWKSHISQSLRGDRNYILYNAMKKYGLDKFIIDVLYVCENFKLSYYEEFFANLLHTYIWDPSPGYNMVRCGSKPRLGVMASEETRRLLSISHMGKTRSKESLEKSRESLRLSHENNPDLWKWANEITRKKLKGRSNADWGSHTPEANAKISAKMTGILKNDEHCRNVMKSKKPGPLTEWDYISPWGNTGKFRLRIDNRTYGKFNSVFDTHSDAMIARNNFIEQSNNSTDS